MGERRWPYLLKYQEEGSHLVQQPQPAPVRRDAGVVKIVVLLANPLPPDERLGQVELEPNQALTATLYDPAGDALSNSIIPLLVLTDAAKSSIGVLSPRLIEKALRRDAEGLFFFVGAGVSGPVRVF